MQLRFHVDTYLDHYTAGHETHRLLTGAQAAALKSRVEGEGGRAVIRPVRVGARTLSFLPRVEVEL